MIADPGSCNRKDKRLLVLLAFGALIVVFRLVDLVPGREQTDKQWLWLEIKKDSDQVYRFTLRQNDPLTPEYFDNIVSQTAGHDFERSSLPTLFDRYKAVVVHIDDNGAEASAKISPRLSFLLGLPFPINHANEDELTMLPGIGPALAARITAYRESRGAISDERDLRSVRGLGRRLVARLAPYLTFEGE